MKIYWEKHLIRDPPELYIKSRQEEETKCGEKAIMRQEAAGTKNRGYRARIRSGTEAVVVHRSSLWRMAQVPQGGHIMVLRRR